MLGRWNVRYTRPLLSNRTFWTDGNILFCTVQRGSQSHVRLLSPWNVPSAIERLNFNWFTSKQSHVASGYHIWQSWHGISLASAPRVRPVFPADTHHFLFHKEWCSQISSSKLWALNRALLVCFQLPPKALTHLIKNSLKKAGQVLFPFYRSGQYISGHQTNLPAET